MIKVVFVILNYNTYEDTIRLTNELLLDRHEDSRIIIVDNASPNESYNRLEEAFGQEKMVDVILAPANGGFAKGNNFGLRYAAKYEPEYVCVINNDVHFTWETIDKLCEIYGKLDKPAVISPIQMLPGNKIAPMGRMNTPTFVSYLRSYTVLLRPSKHQYCSNTKFENVQQVEWIPGAFCFISYKTFEFLGFFDECTFLYSEESFLAHKIKEYGMHSYIILNLTYLHEHSKTINSVASIRKQMKMKYDSKVLYLRKYSNSHISLKMVILNIAFHYYCTCLNIVHSIRKFFKNGTIRV